MKARRILRVFYYLAVTLLVVGCGRDSGREIVIREVPPGRWSARQPVAVVYTNADTLSHRSLAVLVRFRSDFRYDRLDFVLETATPDSLLVRDTLSIRPDPAQAASLSYIDTKTAYRSQSLLRRAGEYRFTFIPLRPVEAVIGVGIEIRREAAQISPAPPPA